MTELLWDGKYRDGRRVAPLRVSLPFQTVETVNETALEHQRTLDLFSTGREPEWRNRLICGDKKYVLPALPDWFAGKIDLVCIDPPSRVGMTQGGLCAPPMPLGSPSARQPWHERAQRHTRPTASKREMRGVREAANRWRQGHGPLVLESR